MTYTLRAPRVSGNTSGQTSTTWGWTETTPLPVSAFTAALVKRFGTSGSDPTPTGVTSGAALLPGAGVTGGTFKTWSGVYVWRGGSGTPTSITVDGTGATVQIILLGYGGITDADWAALVADSEVKAATTGAAVTADAGVTAPADRDCVSIAFLATGGASGAGSGFAVAAPWQKGSGAGGSSSSTTAWAEKITPAGTTTTAPAWSWTTSGVNRLLVYTFRAGPAVVRRQGTATPRVLQGVWDTATSTVKPITHWSFDGAGVGGPDPGETRDPAYLPGAQDDPWNVPLAATATYAAPSEDKTARMRSKSSNGAANRGQWSVAVPVAAPTDPLATITETDVTPNVVYTDVRLPAGFVPPTGSSATVFDGTTTSVAPDHYMAAQWYKLARKLDGSGNPIANQYTTTRRINTDLRGTLIASGTRANGNANLAGLIRKWEADAVSIRHALVFSLPQGDLKLTPTAADGQVVNGKAVWPANTQDTQRTGMAYTGPIPMGTWFALPPTFVVETATLLNGTALTAFQEEVARAAQDFGAVVGDQSSTTAIYLEPTCTQAQADAARLVWREVIIPNLLRVTNIRSDNVGGGTWTATRRRPLAPPFDPSIPALP